MIDDRIATVMQWQTPSEKRKWVARAVDSSVWHRGATADEAMGAALGTICSICGAVQFDSPGGITCPNGHGGASSTDDVSDLF